MGRRNAIWAQSVFFSAAAIVVLSTAALVLFIGYNGLAVFRYMSPLEVFPGTTSNQNDEAFCSLPLFYGSIATTLITLLISAPLAIAVAHSRVEVAPPPVRRVVRTTVALFASV